MYTNNSLGKTKVVKGFVGLMPNLSYCAPLQSPATKEEKKNIELML
jgi:hypothetical protein